MGAFWEPKCLQKSSEILDAILEAKRGGGEQIWGRPGGMRRASGEIIEGYKDPKVAGETRTRAKEL